MKIRAFTLIILLLFVVSSSIAQTDSLVLANTKWSGRKIAKGIYLRQNWFEQSLFHSNQSITILEIKLSGKNRIDIGAEPQQLKGTSVFGRAQDAIAALNGTFFDMKNGGSVDYIRLDGKMLHNNRLPKNGDRSLHQKAAVVIDKKQVRIVKWDSTANWEEKLEGEDIMVTGPLLVKNGQLEKLDSTDMYVVRHPRSAVAIKGDKLLLITIDGRNQRAAGMSLFELASFFKWIGVKDAINLDGGGSTTLWIKDQPDGGVVNYPSDNKKMDPAASNNASGSGIYTQKWDHSGERPVANVIIVTNKKTRNKK